jgi:hypothetical protein
MCKEPYQPHQQLQQHPSQHPQQRSGARSLLLTSLVRFYSIRSNMMAVLPYINGSSAVSLRTIDWFVTNYTRRHDIVLDHRGDDASPMNVYLNYRTQLKAYSKQQFDPFRRRDRIMFYYDADKAVETTIGQMNFFRWLVENRILQYIVEHSDDIELDMVENVPSPLNKPVPECRTARANAVGIRHTAAAHVIKFE